LKCEAQASGVEVERSQEESMARRNAEVARISERGYWSEEEARVVVEAWQESGETMASFARRHGVQAKRVARWVRRLQEPEERTPSGFLPVRVVAPEQLALLLEQMRQLEPPVLEKSESEADARKDAVVEQAIEREEKTARADGRRARRRRERWRTRAIEREVHHVDVHVAERRCAGCGREKRRIGADITRTLEYVPAHFREHEYHLAKYACGTCKDGVSTAEGPAKVIEKSTADASVLAQVVVSKFADHVPLHRQHRIYDRAGVNIPVSTMSNWVAGVADRLLPLVDVLAARVLRAYVVRTDATGLKVLAPQSAETSSAVQCGATWEMIATWSSATHRRERAQPGRGSFWPAGAATSRRMPPVSSTGSSTVRRPAPPKWAAGRMHGASCGARRDRLSGGVSAAADPPALSGGVSGGPQGTRAKDERPCAPNTRAMR
jgi:transposase